MKFFIAGKELHTDRKLEAGPLQNYTELGFESVYSHLLAKRYIKNGLLDTKKDIVVTCKGREFFYNSFIKTISWEDYEKFQTLNLTTSINAAEFIVDSVLQETQYFHENFLTDSKPLQQIYNNQFSWQENYKKYIQLGTPKYKFFEEDYDIITSFTKNTNLVFPKKFVCFNRRFRKHREEYNTDYSYAKNLITQIITTFDVDVFITGFHNEQFEKDISRVKWVNLQDWCTYLNHNDCAAVIQDQTGTSNLSQIFGKEKLLNIVTNNDQTMFTNPLYFNGRRPDVLGKATNFKNLRNIVLKGPKPDQNNIVNLIKKYS